jgi:superfamily I DNA and RNA helicase
MPCLAMIRWTKTCLLYFNIAFSTTNVKTCPEESVVKGNNYIIKNLKTQLNTSQYEAVTTTEGPVLVIAGAGSGKTRVIEYRSLHLVQNDIDPESILLLTFTRRSAQEMIERASRNDARCSKIDKQDSQDLQQEPRFIKLFYHI